MEQKKYSIGEVAGLSGFSRRAIHYYVQLKLLSPPAGAGRGFHYTDEHLEQLRQISELQQKGLSLEEIRDRLQKQSRTAESPMPEPSAVALPSMWVHLPIAAGMTMQLENGRYRLSPARLEHLRKRIAEVARQILEPTTPSEEEPT